MAIDTSPAAPLAPEHTDADPSLVSRPHPLDPLSAAEVEAASAAVRDAGLMPASARFVMISLHEPPKPATLEFDPRDSPPRQAFVIAWDGATMTLSEGVVEVAGPGAGTVSSWTTVPGRFPSFLDSDLATIEDAVRADARWQASMRARGVEDFSLVMIDPWPSGYTRDEDHPSNGRRLCRPLTWLRSAPSEHGYARPIEGLIVTADLDTHEVLEVADHGVVAVPTHAGNYSPDFMLDDPQNRPAFSTLRDDLKPIEITQPEGPSWTIDGWGVSWQKWRLRVGFNPREGLVLHQIAYDDKGVTRPVVYRASLSEMVVPYGDASPTHWNKNVFDMGEVGMGLSSNSLELGCDCLGEIHYFDGVVNDAAGNATTIKNAVCLHEEDHGVSWKHTDFRTGEVEVRRLRRLVISTIATVGNYEYGFFWYLYTDGTIEYDIKLTGVLTTGAIEPGQQPEYGVLVAPGLYGPNHQHFFSVRLDMTVDGPGNSLYEVDSVPEPDPAKNPHHNAWIARSTLVETEGGRDADPSTARYWKVANPSTVNELGQQTAFKLMPGAYVPTMVQEGSAIHDRAQFVQHDLWVTKGEPGELYAAGDYPYQSPDAQGLPEFVAGADSVVDSDLVLWYTVGAHHVVRPEDWPVMPVAHAGFHLKPTGFFDGNPALDMPRSSSDHCGGGADSAGSAAGGGHAHHEPGHDAGML